MAVTVTKTTLAFNTAAAITQNAATSSTADEAEVFTITPTKQGNKVLLSIYNGTGHGAVAFSIAKGVFPQSIAALTGSVAAGARTGIVLEDGKYKSGTGTYVVTLTPASGKRLLTDHAAGMSCVELPG